VSWRSLRRVRESSVEPGVPGLVFSSCPGPLLAVAGLQGGAGASLLAYLIALTAARQSTTPILLLDAGGPTAGIATYTRVSATRSLPELSEHLARGEAVTGPVWAQGESGLRVLAGAPQFTASGEREAILRVLADARASHGLTVADIGTLGRPAEQATLTAATHVAWTLTASPDGVQRARSVLERIAPLSRPEILIARSDPLKRSVPLADLAALADRRAAPLMLLGNLQDATCRASGELAEHAQIVLEGIGGVLHR